MAQQQAMLLETISGMKRAMARNDDASDSDNYISRPTNRGNKLKRKAKFVQQGHLSQADGPRSYKRRIDYNGYSRHVISKNPPRIDADGDVVDDDQETDSDLSLAEDNPYDEVKLESLLMPLTSAANLNKHPSMSVPYTSKILEEMVQNAQELVHREQASLHRTKQLLVQFRGDSSWAACGMYESESDIALLRDLRTGILTPAPTEEDVGVAQPASANWETMSNVRLVADLENAADRKTVEPKQTGPAHPNGDAATGTPTMEDNILSADQTCVNESIEGDRRPSQDVPMEDIDPPKDPQNVPENRVPLAPTGEAVMPDGDDTDPPAQLGEPEAGQFSSSVNGARQEKRDQESDPHPTIELNATTDTQDHAIPEDTTLNLNNDDIDHENDETNQTHRMTTRARAHPPTYLTATATDLNSPPHDNTDTDTETIPPIHPFFIPPTTSIPSPLVNLPPHLADEVRRAFSAYAQKQEEVVRQANSLLEGLRRALKLKRMVWSWCRSEGHVGEMSDGEDWIDGEEWGLEEPLRKGEEVEDEEVGVSIGKKTRNRRAVA